MFIHAVYFWLRNDLTPAQVKQFDAGVRALRAIEVVREGYIGLPAATDRPVIERGYSRALVLVFADERAHHAYQVHPVHDRFRTDCSPLWTKVKIFDSVGDE
jgi:hypothetical protein